MLQTHGDTSGRVTGAEGQAVSFIKKAQEAATQAAEAARARAQEAAAAANRTASDPATAETFTRGAREAVGMARRGVTTVVEKIDPATLADLIIKATALQELTNKSLRTKGSPYRIAEISISASIPPAVSFAIGRLGDEPEEVVGEVVASSDLVDQAVEGGELVLALDGTTVDEAAVATSADVEGEVEGMAPGSGSQG
jgi:vacuolar-type H+-ATPase subunit H